MVWTRHFMGVWGVRGLRELHSNGAIRLHQWVAKFTFDTHIIVYYQENFSCIRCYCSHDVRPATHLAILNRLWRWGEMHSSQNTHPPCQSAEWLTREWTVTNKFHILYRKSGIHRRTGWDEGNVGKPGSVSCVIAIRDWIEGLSAFADPSRRYIEF